MKTNKTPNAPLAMHAIDVRASSWREVGPKATPWSRLFCIMNMFGVDFHCEAVAVTTDKYGLQVAHCQFGNERLDAVSNEFGVDGHFETVRIGRRSYVLVITPYQR